MENKTMANSTLKPVNDMHRIIKQYETDNNAIIKNALENIESSEKELTDLRIAKEDALKSFDKELAMKCDDEIMRVEKELKFANECLNRAKDTPEISKEDCENNTQIIFECVDAINQEKAIEVLKHIDALAKIRDEINDELTIANETRVGMHTIARKEKINPLFYGLRDKDYFVKTILDDIVNNDRIKTLRDIASGHFKNKRF